MRTTRTTFLLSFIWISILCHAQVFQGSGGAIPDNEQPIEFPLEVAGLSTPLDTVSFGVEQVCIDVVHGWLSHLEIWLIAPDGTTVLLTAATGVNSTSYSNTCFKHEAPVSVIRGVPPFNGTHRPIGQLGRVNNYQSGNGNWKLRVLDIYGGTQSGDLLSWSITFGNNPTAHVPFTTSDLPIVVIETNGQLIPKDVKVMGTMFIVDNGPGTINHVDGPYNDHMGYVGIEKRGHSSEMAPKKSYGIEIWDVNGNESEATLLGMPPEQDWVLTANYFDKTLVNNSLAYSLFSSMGHYAARHRHVEVVLNGDPVGIYVLAERIKRGSDRVDIAKLDSTDLSGDELTGGYIIKLDKSNVIGWDSPYPPMASPWGQTIHFHYHYPRVDRIMPEQKAYIQAYVDSFETALAGPDFTDLFEGYNKYIDPESFIDLFLLNELSRNVDGYRLSTYMYKNKNSIDGRLKMGPAWDYDIAWGNVNFCQGQSTSGWAHEYSSVCGLDARQVPFWWNRLLQDPYFIWKLRCRWEYLRSDLFSSHNLNNFVDSVAAYLDEAQQHNFAIWPIFGHQTWSNPEPFPTSYDGEITALKQWITARVAWLDANLPGNAQACTVGVDEIDTTFIRPFPNPFEDHVMVQWPEPAEATIGLIDMLGRNVMPVTRIRLSQNMNRFELPHDLVPGSYVLRITDDRGRTRSYRLQH